MKVPYSLYHGTSLYNLDSIRTHGLGGSDQVKLLRIREAFDELDRFLELADPEFDSLVRGVIRNGNSRYQHEGVYLTHSPQLAWSYSWRSGGCGELGGVVHRMLLRACSLGFPSDSSRFPVFAVLNRPPKPALLRLPSVMVEQLLHDTGHPIQREFWRDELSPTYRVAFRAVCTFPWTTIEVVERAELLSWYEAGLIIEDVP